MKDITKGTTVRLWFNGQKRSATATKQIPGGLWWCAFPKPIEGCTGTIATKLALGDVDPASPAATPQQPAPDNSRGTDCIDHPHAA